MEPTHAVVVTLREIYDAVLRLTGRVDVVITQHDETRNDVSELRSEMRRGNDDHESRLRSLERGRWPLPSAALVLSLGSLAVMVITLVTR